MKKLVTLGTLIGILLALSALAHESGEMSLRIGPDQGITEVSEKEGFKLGAEAEKRFGLKSATVTDPKRVPPDAIVRTLDETGVYRRRNGFIQRIPLAEVKSGDTILTSGIGFIRVIEAAFGKRKSEDEHSKHEDSHSEKDSPSDSHSEDEHNHD